MGLVSSQTIRRLKDSQTSALVSRKSCDPSGASFGGGGEIWPVVLTVAKTRVEKGVIRRVIEITSLFHTALI